MTTRKSFVVVLLCTVVGMLAWAADNANVQKPAGAAVAVKFRPPVAKLEVRGGEATLLRGLQAGLPLQRMPGVRSVSYEQWHAMAEIPKAGLFLVDTDHIPLGLADFLKSEKLILERDGRLHDEKGQPVALFLKSETFSVKGKRAEAEPLKPLRLLFDRTLALLETQVYAANPYPFASFSWRMWWRYHGGFCRDYRAGTSAEAWGPAQGGASPHTRIEYIETRVDMAGRHDRDSCRNCDQQGSSVTWDIGCFWPAHGRASGSHYANWKDGAFSATRTWSWSH